MPGIPAGIGRVGLVERAAEGAFEMTSGETSESGSPPFDITVAHQARVCNFVLGGKGNYAGRVLLRPEICVGSVLPLRSG